MRTILRFMLFFPNFFLFNFLFKAIGVSNQRETTVVWDKLTGEPLYNAVGKLLCVDIKCKAFLPLQVLSYGNIWLQKHVVMFPIISWVGQKSLLRN